MSSDTMQIPYVLRNIHGHSNQRILDLGCGFGKYGWLLKNVRLRDMNCFLVGIDAYKQYLSHLKMVYDSLIVADIRYLPFQNSKLFDVLLCIDVIEHLEKSEGLSMIHNIKRIARKVILTTPNSLSSQGEVGGNPFQEHRSKWAIKDLKQLGFKIFGVGSKFKPHKLLEGLAYYLPFLSRQLLAIFEEGDH